MSILTASNVSKSFGPDDIFEDISVTVPQGAKIALVGPNGAGKTTLLNVLVGLEPPTDGEVSVARGTQIGFLPQRPKLEGTHTVHDEMLTAFKALREQEAEIARIEAQLADADEALLLKYSTMQHEFEEAGGYTYETRIQQVLQGLSFSRELYDRPLTMLSGGQTTRALLARLLLEAPDLLVLDEPTNHLDIAAIEWLENYLKNFEGAVLIVSHDRYFMDKVVSVIWEMEWGEIETYNGNYSHYLQQREERYERRLKEYESFQEFINKEQDYIRKHIGSQNTKQAKGKRRRLERMLTGENMRGESWIDPRLKKRPPKRRNFNMRLKAEVRTGDKVLTFKNLVIGYDNPLFNVPDFTLYRGEVAAIIGPNGSGKTTFLKTIQHKLAPLSGEVEWGAQVQIGYFAQAHEDLNPENTLMDEILRYQDMPISQARSYLANYLFTGDDVFRKVSTLSGGERGRLALAKLALSGANVLLLDEPTNHLDIPSQEILQDVLASFGGTILLVSHDRYIVDALASQIWSINPGKIQFFEGDYAEFLQQRSGGATPVTSSKSTAKEAPKSNSKIKGLNPFQRQKRVVELEKEILALEIRIAAILQELETASIRGDLHKVTTLGEEYNQKEALLHSMMEEWAELAD